MLPAVSVSRGTALLLKPSGLLLPADSYSIENIFSLVNRFQLRGKSEAVTGKKSPVSYLCICESMVKVPSKSSLP